MPRKFIKARITIATLILLGSPYGRAWPWHRFTLNEGVLPTVSAADVGPPQLQEADYKIGVNDVLHIAVWQEPELTATIPVRTDGKISVPLLHDVQAAGLTPMQLTESLTQKLKKYLDDPRVTVVVSQMSAQRIYIVGEVLRKGPMAFLPEMTVFQALATAGLNQFANTKKIYVLRSVNGVQQKLPVNYKQLLKGEAMSQNILLKTGDTIVVP